LRAGKRMDGRGLHEAGKSLLGELIHTGMLGLSGFPCVGGRLIIRPTWL
jgi:hypothetical protein